MLQQQTHVMKINLIGNGAVGKTCILNNYLGEDFVSDYQETIGATFSIKYKKILHNNEEEPRLFKFQIWDIAGQPRYTQVGRILYDNSEGCILVFDIANRTSFNNCQNWLETYLKFAGVGAVCFIGNKHDLREEIDMDLVSSKEAHEFAKQLSEKYERPIKYLETSAKTGHNVDLAFEQLAKTYLDLL